MALGKKCRSLKSKRDCVIDDEELGFEFVRYTRAFWRKRIVVSSNGEVSDKDSDWIGDGVVVDSSEICRLQALPQEILIRILCSVNHDDLKQLFHVSKAIREAALISRKCHFAFSTPSKTPAFRTLIDLEDMDDENEAPKAPKQLRSYRSPIIGKNLDHISISLFTSPDDADTRL